MYLESKIFKRTKDSEWEKGYYIGEDDNSIKSIMLDSNFQPVFPLWDSRVDTDNWIIYRS